MVEGDRRDGWGRGKRRDGWGREEEEGWLREGGIGGKEGR